MAILDVQHIEKHFGGTQVLRDISFSLEEGQALSIIGSSGSGKTTLLRCLNFLETPDKGVISVRGETLFDAEDTRRPSEAEIRQRRLHFGLVFQSFNLFPQYTALQNVTLARELMAKENHESRDAILKEGKPTFTLVDFHAEATSEKLAMGYYLDGRVSALWGTHTHVPTADGRVLPKGTGYQTDLGMCGAVESVLGIEPRQSIETFLGGLPGRYRSAEGPCKLEGCLFTLDSATGLCVGVERLDIR